MAKVYEPKVGDKRELGGRMSADLFGQALLRVLKKQRKTVDQLLALKPEEIRGLQEMKDEVNDISQETEAAKEIGDIAVKAGLHSIDISTKDLQAAFAEIAARFSKETN